ncbi:MAG: single-stranded DNA-binding protein [Acholeplasmataceae bacterium]
MINKIILVGRITKDPELRRTSGDIPVVNFSIAVNRNYTDASGERKADFINCVVWRRQAENMERFVKKGMLLGIEGRLQQNQYETEQGTRSTYEVLCDSVQFLESKNASSSSSYDSEPTQDKSDEYYEASKTLAAEEDLPF